MWIQLPATTKAHTGKAGTDVEESDLVSGRGRLEDGELMSQRPSFHISGGRRSHKEGQGNRTKRPRVGLKSSLCADEDSPFQ